MQPVQWPHWEEGGGEGNKGGWDLVACGLWWDTKWVLSWEDAQGTIMTWNYVRSHAIWLCIKAYTVNSLLYKDFQRQLVVQRDIPLASELLSEACPHFLLWERALTTGLLRELLSSLPSHTDLRINTHPPNFLFPGLHRRRQVMLFYGGGGSELQPLFPQKIFGPSGGKKKPLEYISSFFIFFETRI